MKEISYKEFVVNPFVSIGEDWVVVASGNEKDNNAMTISWGHIGSLWGSHFDGTASVVIYIRKSRYTDSFIDRNNYFTCSFFSQEYHKQLMYIGTHSGRDSDKMKEANLEVGAINGAPYIKGARYVLLCKKVYKGEIKPENFVDKTIIERWYNDGDFHNVYIGEVKKIFINE